MARDSGPAWTEELLHRRGLLFQGASLLAPATCLDSHDRRLILAPLADLGELSHEARTPLVFQVTVSSGIIRIRGVLARKTDARLELEMAPGQPEISNRRAHYRVQVSLRAHFAETAGEDGEAFGGRQVEGAGGGDVDCPMRPCIVRDLSLGGAKISYASPAPPAGARLILDLAVAPGVRLRDLRCTLIDGRAGVAPAPFDAQMRVRFSGLPPRQESSLARQIARLQMEMLRKGVRG